MKRGGKFFKRFFCYVCAGVCIIGGVLYLYLFFSKGNPAQIKGVFQTDAKQILVFAHRGGGGLFPENTIKAFQHSVSVGVDVLELDVYQTLDGYFVVMHDEVVDHTTNGTGRISDMSLNDIKKLDAGFSFSRDGGTTFPFRGKGITIPTLDEIFASFPKIKFNIEPKQKQQSVAVPLCREIQKSGKIHHAIVASFHRRVLIEFRRACPDVATSASLTEAAWFFALYKIGLGKSYSPPMQFLQIPENFNFLHVVSKRFIKAAHALNLQVHVWTVNESNDMRRMIDMNVDGIITDYPDRLLKLLKREN